MHPVLFETTFFGLFSPPWQIYSYGVLIAAGFLLAMLLGVRAARASGEDPERIVDLGFYVLLSGFVGSRLLFILIKLPVYVESPARVLKFWLGGYVWYGGFIAAALYVLYYCRKHRVPFLKYADIMVPYMALAHGFGRLGCLAAGCCYGSPTLRPWGIRFPIGSLVHQAQQSAGLVGMAEPPLAVHPTQVYESLVEFALFVGLLALRRRQRYDGQLLVTWLSFYAVARFIVELFRGDLERGVYGLSASQYVSIGILAVAVILVSRLRAVRRTQPEPGQAVLVEGP
jgi:phosphatidylglycerol:prolipoprotein diacylglycerol transferase